MKLTLQSDDKMKKLENSQINKQFTLAEPRRGERWWLTAGTLGGRRGWWVIFLTALLWVVPAFWKDMKGSLIRVYVFLAFWQTWKTNFLLISQPLSLDTHSLMNYWVCRVAQWAIIIVLILEDFRVLTHLGRWWIDLHEWPRSPSGQKWTVKTQR